MNIPKKHGRGFTLIELIAVIVILGILAAAAVPRFVDLSQAARDSAVLGVAGNLSSASALNYANAVVVTQYSAGMSSPSLVTNCDHAENLLDGGLPEGYDIEPAPSESGTVNNNESITCVVFDETDNTARAEFVLHGVSP